MRNVSAALALFIAACGGGGSDDSQGGGATSGPPPAPPPVVADITLLFMGNSHTSANDLTTMVADMVSAGEPDQSVGWTVAPGSMFLDERLEDEPTMTLLQSQDWSFVILQAQKYSSSGQFEYSTEEAKELIRISRDQHAVPVLFPEWPREGIDETQRIYDLHVSIAQAEPACVAPIPQAFDLAMARDPTLTLWASDGNHSSPSGAFLAALVLYATITERSPLELPSMPQFPVDASVQDTLRGVAAETVETVPPRMWCPGDAG
jgi:hypothetical protein